MATTISALPADKLELLSNQWGMSEAMLSTFLDGTSELERIFDYLQNNKTASESEIRTFFSQILKETKMQLPTLFRRYKHCFYCGSDKVERGNGHYWDCPSCGNQYFLNAASAVACILYNERKEILLTIRKKDPCKGMLDLPGGFVNILESAEDAVMREIYEELNIRISKPTYLCSAPNEYIYKDNLYYTTDLVFTAELPKNAEGIQAQDDVADFVWLSLDKIDLQKVAFRSIRKALGEYITVQK